MGVNFGPDWSLTLARGFPVHFHIPHQVFRFLTPNVCPELKILFAGEGTRSFGCKPTSLSADFYPQTQESFPNFLRRKGIILALKGLANHLASFFSHYFLRSCYWSDQDSFLCPSDYRSWSAGSLWPSFCYCFSGQFLGPIDLNTVGYGNWPSSPSLDSIPRHNRLPVIWESDLTDKIKRSFFQAAVVSILLYRCTTWTLTKCMEKKLDGNYTRMMRAILTTPGDSHPKSSKSMATYHPSRKLSKLDEQDMRDIAGEVGTIL